MRNLAVSSSLLAIALFSFPGVSRSRTYQSPCCSFPLELPAGCVAIDTSYAVMHYRGVFLAINSRGSKKLVVERGLRVEDFHIGNVPDLLAERGDLWKPLLEPRGRFRLEKLMEKRTVPGPHARSVTRRPTGDGPPRTKSLGRAREQ